MKRIPVLPALTALVALWTMTVFAAVPQLINFQGILRDGSGNPVPNSTYSVTFRIYDAPSGGSILWTESQSVGTSGGLFTVLLGSATVGGIPDAVLSDSSRYLGITVSPDPEMTPRQKLASVAYGYRVNSVDGASGGTITSKVSIGPGHTNTGAHAFVAGQGNSATGDYTTISGGIGNSVGAVGGTTGGGIGNAVNLDLGTIGGGTSNQTYGVVATVGGGFSNISGGDSSTIGGGSNNTTNGISATVSGGSLNQATGEGSTVSGGENNNARAQFSVVGGGGGPTAADSNSALGETSTISGGRGNKAGGQGATVSGGLFHTASGDGATIGGGGSNVASNVDATIAGGGFNIASGTFATVSGGGRNRARGDFSVVGGGGGPTASDSNSALGNYSTIGGGHGNLISSSALEATIGGGIGNFVEPGGITTTIGGGVANRANGGGAAIGGGLFNNASGDYAAIAGGSNNFASGRASTVGGGGVNKARGDYSVVGGGGGPTAADSNSALGDYSTIGGGTRNVIFGLAFYATIGGGWENLTSSEAATVSGGYFNWATGANAAVGGGGGNVAEGYSATISGGRENRASGNFAMVGGGHGDTALGFYSVVPGGEHNRAFGNYSFAAGRRAYAANLGTFVWADSSVDADFTSTANNQFLIRAAGGVGIGTNAPGTMPGLESARLEIADEDGSKGSLVSRVAGTGSGDLLFAKSRGTLSSPSIVQSGDLLGNILFFGYDGTDFASPAAYIQASVDGTPGVNDMPGRLEFRTTPDGSATTATRMTIKSDGSVGIGTTAPQGALDVSSTTGAFIVPRMTTTQRDALTAVNGTIVYNTTTNQFNFRENGAWVLK